MPNTLNDIFAHLDNTKASPLCAANTSSWHGRL